MFQPRIIPVLLMKGTSLVKTVKFKKPNYIGDPINAVHIFNQLNADELVFLDIEATAKKRPPNFSLIKKVGEESNMPFAVGGGIRNIETIKEILKAGAEKVIIGSYALESPEFIKIASDQFGSSTIAVCIDIKNTTFFGHKVYSKNGTKASKRSPIEVAKNMETFGAGEIIIQSIDRDGLMEGYDIDLIRSVSENVKIPVIALGGAGKMEHLEEAYTNGCATGLAGGSFFVYQSSNKGVLITYPEKSDRTFVR